HERAGVVLEQVVHLAGGEARLHDVVTVGALRARLHLDADVGGLLHERIDEGLRGGDRRLAVVDQEGQGGRASLTGTGTACGAAGEGERQGETACADGTEGAW